MIRVSHHLLSLTPQLFKPNPRSSLHDPLFPATLPSTPLPLPPKKPPRPKLVVLRAASIASPGSSEYPEKLAGDAKDRKKKRTVAGVDQDELLDAAELAEPDSFFCEFNGVRIHHKICHHGVQEQEDEGLEGFHSFEALRSGEALRTGLPMILLHGFGASVFSWDRVMRPLARLTGSKVLAFDRPAFGLTSRVSYLEKVKSEAGDSVPLNPYSMAFSVLATLSFIDLLGSGKAILMGHSAGCLVAVSTYFEAPERVAALILVAPAIVAPLVLRKGGKENQTGEGNQMEGEGSSLAAQENPFVRIWKTFCRFCMHLAGAVFGMLRGMRDMVSSLYVKALSAVLRSSFAVMLVRMVIDKFGILAIRNAWYDAKQVTDHVVQGYTKPLRARGWEMALLEYTLAMITNPTSKSRPPLMRRLSEISCPVLIVTGDTDRLVPSWNAERLSLAIPGSTLETIKNCGHLPHEEKVEEFLLVVERFLQRIFGAPEVQFSQATA